MVSGRKVVIVGAGPGGLSAALQLAHAGCDVTVLEKRSSVGGRTSAIEIDQFRFDIGPTFFLYPRVLKEIFQSIGKDLFDVVPMQRLETQYRLVFGQGGQLDCSADLQSMDRQIAAISPRDAGSLKRFLDVNRKKLKKFRPILESPFESVLDLFRPSVLAALPQLHPFRSLADELSSYFHDDRIAMAFGFQSKYLGMSPDSCPSLFSILSFLEYEHGVWHPDGGCSRVSERMAEIAESMGVNFHLSCSVNSVETDGKRVTAVSTKDQRFEADAFVVNADFAHWMTSVVPNSLRKRWSDRRVDRTKFSCSTFMLYLGIEGMIDAEHHTIYLSEDYRQNLDEIENQHVLSNDPSFYLQNACVTDSSLAPSGHSTLYLLVPVSHQHSNIEWGKQRESFREVALNQLRKIGVDLDDRIRIERCITPDDWQNDFAIHLGATFNMAHGLDQMLHRRPHNRFEDLDGVYLVGGGTHPGSGLPVIFESSRITSRLLLDDLGID